ncbi:MAG: hypothetical protein ACTS2F_01015 [Thainema sp.]
MSNWSRSRRDRLSKFIVYQRRDEFSTDSEKRRNVSYREDPDILIDRHRLRSILSGLESLSGE